MIDLPRLRVRDPQILSGRLEVTTIADSQALMVREFVIPGRNEMIGITAFRGLPYEMVSGSPGAVPHAGGTRDPAGLGD